MSTREGRDLFVKWCEDAGCTVSVDAMGNIFARRAGRDDTLAPVMAGSHLDSQPTGGKFDGAYGVLAALEVVRALNDAGYETTAPIEVVAWTNEEGSRFAPAMIGSGTFAGVFELDYAHQRADPDGLTLGAELERIGYNGDGCGGRSGRRLLRGPTSSRAPSSKRKRRPSAWSPAPRLSAGTRSP